MNRKFFQAPGLFILNLLTLTVAIPFLLAGSLFASGKAEETKKTYRIPEIEGKIKIDGTLNEEAWARALKVAVDIEIMPGENIEAPAKTECFLFYDRHNLYIGFIAHDPEPNKIRAFYNDRDNCWQDDLVGIILDTFNDENRAFAFFINPLGIQGDEIMSLGGQQEDPSWDAIWNSAARLTGSGYEVEIAIPFSSLQFQPSENEQTWGFLPIRIMPRSRRYQITMMPFNRNNPCTLCQAPKITGFKGISAGRNLELDPTLIGARTDARETFPTGDMKKLDSKADFGISG
ncbi:MAG TPA: carbohydrate binding family 9 domain-containing protein, partial [Candidatus Saccharicenans sp.]|nr:carbohydrate binding family 9 domain-containing protein [Candidatus Saccharicenans sp.]